MLIGAHVSTAGGWALAPGRARAIGADAMQIFTGSPRVWKGADPDKVDYEGMLAAQKREGIGAKFIHATYLINLASDNPALVEKSRNALIADMEICGRGGFGGVVVHVGSHQGRGYGAVRQQLTTEISGIIAKTPDEGVFLIENSAGQNGKIASDLEEIRDLLDGVGSKRLGWCVDTCHAHAAGYAFGKNQRSKIRDQNDKPGLFDEKARPKMLVDEIERLKLWGSLRCVHVNDSRDPFGSGRDRHANLGEGQILEADFREFFAHPKVAKLSLILEVPGMDGKGPDAENIKRLAKLAGSK